MIINLHQQWMDEHSFVSLISQYDSYLFIFRIWAPILHSMSANLQIYTMGKQICLDNIKWSTFQHC